MAQDRAPQELPDGLRLSQYGERSPLGEGFRDRLRVEIGETEISLILGDVDADAASMLVTKCLSAWAIRRLTTVGRLRGAGSGSSIVPPRRTDEEVTAHGRTTDAGQSGLGSDARD